MFMRILFCITPIMSKHFYYRSKLTIASNYHHYIPLYCECLIIVIIARWTTPSSYDFYQRYSIIGSIFTLALCDLVDVIIINSFISL